MNDRVGVFRLDDGGLGVTKLGSPEILKIDEIDNNFKNKILCGDVREVLKKLPDECIDMSVTSPPYFSLRNYNEDGVIWDGDENCDHEWNVKETELTTGCSNKSTIVKYSTEKYAVHVQKSEVGFCKKCGGWKGQLGLESNMEDYIKHLCDIFDGVKRVLKPEGTCWVNIGDTYAGSGCKLPHHKIEGKQLQQVVHGAEPKSKPDLTISDKSLCGIPFRFSLEMKRRGWILRNTIIWHKINQIPSSAKDRFTVNFEYLFFFAKNKNYYFEQQFESYNEPIKRWGGEFIKSKNLSEWDVGTGQKTFRDRSLRPNLQGRNKRTTWSINTQPIPDNHFAAYPVSLIETPMKAGCPEFICKECGEKRKKIYKEIRIDTRPGDLSKYRQLITRIEEGYTKCNCNEGFESGIVLDPFIGSGTTAIAARKLGRDWVGIEINEEYCEMCKKRIIKTELK
jgi:site-specific DNA-methyltransferase (adenine-specific)